MTKKMKGFIIVCSIIIGTGLLLSTLGFVLGGFKGFSAVENRIPWVSLGAPGNQIKTGKSFDSFSSMDIECDIGKIRFEEGDTYKVEVKYDQRNEPVIAVENDTLIVKCNDKRKDRINLDFLGGWCNKGSSLTIYYPKKATFKDVIVNNDLGDIRLTGLTAKTINIEANLGNVVLDGVKADKLTGNLDLGNLEGSSLVTKGLDMNLNLGNIDIEGAFAGTSKVYCDLGNCKITTSLPKSGYAVVTTLDLGNCKIDGSFVGAGYVLENPDATNKMELQCNLGDIKINFQ